LHLSETKLLLHKSKRAVAVRLLQLRMKKDESCVILCQKIHTKPDVEMFKSMIDQEYRVHWLLDNLPVAVRNEELGYVSRGYPVGFMATTPKSKTPQHYLFNHVRIIVRYNENPEAFSGTRIVGFEVVPFSIKVSPLSGDNHAGCEHLKFPAWNLA
jgi:transmembrane 9 superfamily protein 2/4